MKHSKEEGERQIMALWQKWYLEDENVYFHIWNQKRKFVSHCSMKSFLKALDRRTPHGIYTAINGYFRIHFAIREKIVTLVTVWARYEGRWVALGYRESHRVAKKFFGRSYKSAIGTPLPDGMREELIRWKKQAYERLYTTWVVESNHMKIETLKQWVNRIVQFDGYVAFLVVSNKIAVNVIINHHLIVDMFVLYKDGEDQYVVPVYDVAEWSRNNLNKHVTEFYHREMLK